MSLRSAALLVLTHAAGVSAYAKLQGVMASRVRASPDAPPIDLGRELEACTSTSAQHATCVIFGTYAADFNAIEYGQRVRHYLPKLRQRGVERVLFIVNAEPDAARTLADRLDLPEAVELLADPTGAAGLAFGVARGWRPDDAEMSPYLKLFGMLFGLGAWATLPAVIGGYLGNPLGGQPWIEDALAQGARAGRWPANALELDPATGEVLENKFAALPLVGSWPRRPLELATLRLQNMLGLSLKEWDALRPADAQLQLLTQLGGCLVLGPGGEALYEWKDPGICAVCNFEDVLAKLERSNLAPVGMPPPASSPPEPAQAPTMAR